LTEKEKRDGFRGELKIETIMKKIGERKARLRGGKGNSGKKKIQGGFLSKSGEGNGKVLVSYGTKGRDGKKGGGP